MPAGNKRFLCIATVMAGVSMTFLSPVYARGVHTHPHRVHRHVHVMYGGARVLQCVTFAKEDAGIDISGNARDWWNNAAGIYQRGSRPENGSVLSFRANSRMPLGHVAVVSNVRDGRTITIDQSHWNSRGISRDIEVEDVSEDNDWSAVRVQLGHGGGFGSIYPTHGFIYPRPEQSFQRSVNHIRHGRVGYVMTALVRDIRQARPATVELAELPRQAGSNDVFPHGIAMDSPNRGLR